MDKIENRKKHRKEQIKDRQEQISKFQNKEFKERRKKNLSDVWLQSAQSARFALRKLPQGMQVKKHKNRNLQLDTKL